MQRAAQVVCCWTHTPEGLRAEARGRPGAHGQQLRTERVRRWHGRCLRCEQIAERRFAMLSRRFDGTPAQDLPAYRRIIPFVMRGRNESAVYFEQTVDLTHTLPWIERFNAAHEDRISSRGANGLNGAAPGKPLLRAQGRPARLAAS